MCQVSIFKLPFQGLEDNLNEIGVPVFDSSSNLINKLLSSFIPSPISFMQLSPNFYKLSFQFLRRIILRKIKTG